MARQALHEVEKQTPWELSSAMADTVSPGGALPDWSSADDRHSEALERESDEDDVLGLKKSEDLTERVLLRRYVQEVARHPLLGREREFDLARTIREGQEALIGLIPIMWSIGAGSDVMKRIAAPMIGGIFTSFLLELLVYPAMYQIWKWNFEVKKQLPSVAK